MDILLTLARLLMKRASSDALLRLAQTLSNALTEKFTPAERVTLVRQFLEENMPKWLEGMTREEKASLMNSLLPLMAREFPLNELDILGAFAAPPGVERR